MLERPWCHSPSENGNSNAVRAATQVRNERCRGEGGVDPVGEVRRARIPAPCRRECGPNLLVVWIWCMQERGAQNGIKVRARAIRSLEFSTIKASKLVEEIEGSKVLRKAYFSQKCQFPAMVRGTPASMPPPCELTNLEAAPPTPSSSGCHIQGHYQPTLIT